MVKAPKPMRPRAPMGALMSARTLRAITASTDQRRVAIKTSSSALPNAHDDGRPTRTSWPKINAAKATSCNLPKRSLSSGTARMATQINRVLWMKAALGAVDSLSPQKNSRKGRLPPIRPNPTREAHCRLDSFRKSSQSMGVRTSAPKARATSRFLAVVNTKGSDTCFTPKELM